MKPTLLILTANHPDQKKLDYLLREGKQIQRLLNSAYGREYETVLVPECTIHDLIAELMVPNRLVEALHFAGHADDKSLLFRDSDADARSLADKLKNLGTVKLIFLNGCGTRSQVHYFHAAGIPAVIATSRVVDDEQAYWVATQYYQYLILGRSLEKAYAEVVLDARELEKKVMLSYPRVLAGREELHGEQNKEEELPWGLYFREASDVVDYSLPFLRSSRLPEGKVSHTSFLTRLVLAFKDTEEHPLAEIRALADVVQRGSTPDSTKVLQLRKVLPMPLGIRLRQIVAKPETTDKKYYRDLLYDYAFFFDTLLHLIVGMLFARIWQFRLDQPDKVLGIPEETRGFLLSDLRITSPAIYVSAIDGLLESLKKGNVTLFILLDDLPLDYLHSPDFQSASAFFFLQKQHYWHKIRQEEDKALENCFIAQDHLATAFSHLGPVVQHAMVSVRQINVINFRYVPGEIENMVAHLIEADASPRPLPGDMMENHAVLCYDKREHNLTLPSLNLFPFLIDRNVFTRIPNDEVDLYLFIGFFPGIDGDKPACHFASVRNPGMIWRFSYDEGEASLRHVGEEVTLAHEKNHLLMGNAWAFEQYLEQFHGQFIQSPPYAG